jgi:hypothetical protein
LDGNNTVVGGREEGVKVTVTNSGKGIAKWVRVVLEGDEYLTRLWGSEQNLDDLKPGESKTATFSLLMPTDLERRQAKLRVVVKEGRGYSPTEVPELTLNLVPAERTATQVEVVEDVSHGLPDAGNHRSSATALVIGVSSYPSAPLKYARQDADAFRLYASQVLGIPEANTTVLLDEQATGSRIRGRLQDWMKKKTGFKAIFFSGHGTTNPENAKDSIPYLVPHDGDRELKSTLVPTDAIADLCSSDKDTLVVFLDACLSGGDKPLVNQVIPDTRAVTLASSQGSRPSKEFEKAQHGYFTYYTLLGLKGKADSLPYGNNDDWVTTTELYNYVKKNVSDATNEVQVPVLRPARDIKLGRVR